MMNMLFFLPFKLQSAFFFLSFFSYFYCLFVGDVLAKDASSSTRFAWPTKLWIKKLLAIFFQLGLSTITLHTCVTDSKDFAGNHGTSPVMSEPGEGQWASNFWLISYPYSSQGGGQILPTLYYCHPQIFHLPAWLIKPYKFSRFHATP